jgi:hypothetical protein
LFSPTFPDMGRRDLRRCKCPTQHNEPS